MSPRYFVKVFNDYEYDRFQNLDLRFVIGAGLGYHALKTERTVVDLLAGADYNRSSFTTPLARNWAELYSGDEYAYDLSGATSLFRASACSTTSRTPAPGRKTNDLLYTTGVGHHLRPVITK
jgi:hypothetical protein